MESAIYHDKHIENLIWWTPGAELQWDGFHVSIDQLCAIADESQLPIIIIMHPTADIPKGSPFPHLKRFLMNVGKHDNIQNVYLVMESKFIFGQMIMKILETLMNITEKFMIVDSRAIALEKITQEKDSK